MQHVSAPFLFPGRSLLSQMSERGYIDTGVETDGRIYLAEVEVDEIVRLALEHFPGLVEERIGAVDVLETLAAAQARIETLEAELAVAEENRVVPLADVIAMQRPSETEPEPEPRKKRLGRGAGAAA